MMFFYRVRLFSLFGFDVYVDASWLLLAVLIAWTLATGVFPGIVSGLASATYWSMAVVARVGLLFSIVLVAIGLVLVVVGLLWPWLGKLGLGRLPGDIVIERGNFHLYFPIVTCLIISIVLSFFLWLLNRYNASARLSSQPPRPQAPSKEPDPAAAARMLRPAVKPGNAAGPSGRVGRTPRRSSCTSVPAPSVAPY
jgi:Protein of unknown function (DUF2905)